ncbi:ricin-type beta-trefoil lectin domain protein [Streptomyces sp. NPDC004549]|uniref:ricin-type beta-trefoil lectin domain protein n=1 Tax=Streptomyces sp. NPDC004549 TaxID=3154283 RepID=UPI0033B1E8E8
MPGPHAKSRNPDRRWTRAMCAVGAALVLAVAAPATTARARAQSGSAAATADAVSGLGYVAMGSSFAAGPGIPPAQAGSKAAACARSAGNYASIVARETGADLTDVSCSGATTANVLTTSQSGQPPQVRAVTAATRVVTVTIGGNDVDYLGSINAYSCRTGGGTACGSVDRNAIDQTFPSLAGRIGNVVDAVRGAAPQAQVYLVGYFTLLPDAGVCADVPLTGDQAAFERGTASRLADATATAASATGATLVDLAAASHGHDACAQSPWVETYRPAAGRSAYHPNEAGMAAAASLVESALTSHGQAGTAVFRSGITGKCLDVRGSGTAGGTQVRLYACNGTDAQRWTWVPGAGGTLRAPGGCLDVNGGGSANGTTVRLWQCNGSAAQRWVPAPGSSLVNPRSGRCLDDPAGSTADGTRLQIHDCNGTAAQRWTPAA